ncbi:MAG: 3-hydroxyacyl-CoA dehydrogenase NAD-binding domain-containing protein [Bacteroidota bacterium]|nr:3-hydroxyacyl-CoA dehydrogenase NAD-binding domain-containing protein [Bacteroidota bacterium]
MKPIKIKKIGIAGAGTMGIGIAQVCAMAGYQVYLFDLKIEIVQKAEKQLSQSLDKLIQIGKLSEEGKQETLSLVKFTDCMDDLKVDLVIEAIVEKTEPKVELFSRLMEINGENCIYGTNTSSIPITQIAAKLKFPELLVGIHFFNPAQIMKLVEIIKGAKTHSIIVEQAYNFVKHLKKQPVIAADAPGFIVNRVARLYYVESLKLLEEGVATIETVDAIMESSGFKMGPFRLMDLIGIDTNYSVTESQYNLFNQEARFRPSRIQKQKVEAGLHGRKTKEGFYKYE